MRGVRRRRRRRRAHSAAGRTSTRGSGRSGREETGLLFGRRRGRRAQQIRAGRAHSREQVFAAHELVALALFFVFRALLRLLLFETRQLNAQTTNDKTHPKSTCQFVTCK